MSEQRFKATIASAGRRAHIAIPFDPHVVWGARERHFVTGSINGCAFRGTIEAQGARRILPLGPAWMRDNGLEVGAEVELALSPEGPQLDNVAHDVLAALDGAPQARDFFLSLPTFYRKNFIRWIEGAKRPDTRSRRIAEMIQLLRAGKRER